MNYTGKIFIRRCAVAILLVLVFLIPAIRANAATGTPVKIIPFSTLQQEVRLGDPTPAALGGRGFIDTGVRVVDSNGNGVYGIPVTFEAIYEPALMTVLMRGTNKSSVTVETDVMGLACSENTNWQFLGEGFQVYSNYVAIKRNVKIKASAPGLEPIVINVTVYTYVP